MSKPEHSPLPWYVSGVRAPFPSGPALTIASECDGHGYAYIPYSDRRPGDHASAYADANFVVTACNAYYENKAAIAELVEALERTKENLHEIEAGDMSTYEAQDQLDALIAKHKAKP